MFGWKAKAIEAQAEILDEGLLLDKPKLVSGYAYGTFEYQVEVRPADMPAQRAVASGLACTGCKPEPGDVVRVKFLPKEGTATFELEGDARYDPVVVSKEHVDFGVAKDGLYAVLESGDRGVATVVAVRIGRHRFDNEEIRTDVRIKTRSGAELDATIVEWLRKDDPRPTVGETRPVAFDSADVSRIDWWESETGMRWVVPTKCPECGASVDQSRASVAAHPTCAYCSKPLPCQPT
jgi:hypothetical protein